jgi:cysteine desulfurase
MSKNKRPIYLDYQSTTPLDPRVLEVMLPYFTEKFGNAASKSHGYGQEAHQAVESARGQLAKAINAKPQEVIFTSGATEAINLAIKGLALRHPDKNRHFITVETEHKAVLDCFYWLKQQGFEITILPVNSEGILSPSDIQAAIQPNTELVAVMAANNEIGVLQAIDEIGEICRLNGVFFFCDATQALGSIPIDVVASKIDLLAASAHKVYGPKGVGMLYVKRSNPTVKLQPIAHGGGHERGFRSGTLPTPLIVGFGEAVEIAVKMMPKESKRLASLRDALLVELQKLIPEAIVNGSLSRRLPNNLNISFPGVDAEALIAATTSDIAIATGSACTSSEILPSHVLTAIGMPPDQLASSLRISVGRSTLESDIHFAGKVMTENYLRLKRFS